MTHSEKFYSQLVGSGKTFGDSDQGYIGFVLENVTVAIPCRSLRSVQMPDMQLKLLVSSLLLRTRQPVTWLARATQAPECPRRLTGR